MSAWAHEGDGNVGAPTVNIPHPTLPQCQRDDPDLLLPDLVADKPTSVRNIFQGGRRVVVFTTAAANVGDGPLVIQGQTVSTPERVFTLGYQIIWKRDGSKCARAAGEFIFHPSHQHFHFDDFYGYELRADDPLTGPMVAKGAKASFCLLDIENIRGFRPDDFPRQVTNRTCDSQEGTQGISVGWKDVYERFVPGQFISLDLDDGTQVPVGSYFLLNVVDPDHLLWEKNTENNTSFVPTAVFLPPPDLATVLSRPTLRPRRPILRVGRSRPTRAPRVRATRAPRVRATRAPRVRATRAVRVRPTRTPRVRAARPHRMRPARPSRPQRPQHPAHPRGPHSLPNTPTLVPTATFTPVPAEPAAAGGPAGTPTSTVAPATSCENACAYGVSQIRMLWYGSLDLSMFISPRGCDQLTPDFGSQGAIQMTNFLTEARDDTGVEHFASYELADEGAGMTSTDGTVQFTPVADGFRFSYRVDIPAPADANDGINFPVVFDFCLTLDEQAVKARLVCQPKNRGMLCHQG
ncbi:MAG: lysyl oxidase family protein [Candidatus Binatia bacterium]